MPIWKQLYAMVWLAFLQIVLITAARITTYLLEGHVFLGLVILGLAHYDSAKIKNSEAPLRLKRIVKATAVLATIQLILGAVLFLNIRL